MSSAILLFFILFIEFFAIFCSVKAFNTTFGCIAGERKALLRFRERFSEPYSALSSWKGQDCCTWLGIRCDKFTGHVISLDLGNKGLLGKTLDSSLLELKHLSYLDLSGSDFQHNSFPAFIGSMKQLQYLNLSLMSFHGVVPHNLGNLSSLRVLDLSRIDDLIVDDLAWISRLSSLEHLDLSYVDLSPTKDLLKVLNMLSSIQKLGLSSCRLNNTNLQHACVNVNYTLANVRYLDLSFNSFDGELPCFLHNMTLLRELDLSSNYYNSTGHHLFKLSNLVRLNLGSNSLSNKVDWISEFLWNKCHLKSVDLSLNQIYGEISTPFRNLSRCWNQNIEELDLAGNKFYGHLPEEIGGLKKLMYLDLTYNVFINGTIPNSLGKLSALRVLVLANNNLSGSIPSSVGDLRKLELLDLSNNNLFGSIPSSLGDLRELEELDLSNNQLGPIPSWLGNLSALKELYLGQLSNLGTFYEDHFANLSKLSTLVVSPFKFKVKLDWVPPFQLRHLTLFSCDIGGQFPQWVQMQKELEHLSIKNCSISDTLSNSLNNLKNLNYLDLSNNHIQGPIPNNISQMLPFLERLYLDKNSINGSLPDSLCEIKSLQLMDLSRNHLSGNLPECLGKIHDLMAMRLSSNEISGVIPNSISGAYSLEYLNLNNNSLTGKLPHTMKNCTKLIVEDIGENIFLGKLPHWVGNYLPDLRLLRLRNNKFYGQIPFEVCQLLKLQMLDLANNNLTGGIPNCFGNLSGMVLNSNYDFYWGVESFTEVLKGLELEYFETSRFLVNLDVSNNNLVGKIPWELTRLSGLIGLNLSHNHLVGEIPEIIGDMKSMESLDLSNNNLSGTIPSSLSDLSSISYLNLSNNNLSGKIPTGRQLQTLDYPSIYEGNPRLCGAPLPKKCEEASMVPSITDNHVAANEGDNIIDDKVLFSIVIICGFATGFWGVIGALVFNKRWRYAYFEFAEERIIRRLFRG
ncbi:hypothetical protein RD792_006380 [Penstemon davidsonii]|uniref:Leucine-rich repeat-containing N-terminal plant-type domain-containing protein n=1 Tax=Penstemon davidsonii TaxID=160366 RepID=A0ABR0DCT3_9LAMI|nr:hypothetical protein RD792_006380 [Penstemon davidsonii]